MAFSRSRTNPPEYIYIPGGLRPGASIIIRGLIPSYSDGFAVNLRTNDDPDGNIAFHFNPRVNEGEVVRNTFLGDWGDEDRSQPYFPFSSGARFQLRIHASNDDFHVMVNGHNFIKFNYRTDVREVQFLHLGEGAQYDYITVQNSMGNPHDEELRGSFDVGQAVRIRGAVKEGGENFAINFSCDRDGNTIAFHFNARFNEGEVVRNSLLGGWGDEERDQDQFPFSHGEMFEILFIAQSNGFNVYVNERFFTTYNHRCDVRDIRFIKAVGDVSICDIEFFEPLPDDFMKPVPSGLEKSDMVIVRGFFQPEGENFAINLMNGESLDDDIGLHFNPRRNEGECVLNNRVEGGWLEEERVAIPQTFNDLVPFEVKIVVKKSKFKIYVNEKKLVSFRSRCCVEDIKQINVKGDAWIYQVKLLRRLEVPNVDCIPGGLRAGAWVVVNGTPKKDAQGFAINLQTGESSDYQDDVGFHFNPRLNEGDSVRNSLLGGGWGDEERDQPNFPFEPEDAFTIAINCLDDKYRVYVNGQRYIDFSHRIDPSNLNHIMLTGDANFFEPEFY